MDCRVCSTPDNKKPQIFRGEPWCCDRHRKVILREVHPTLEEKGRMDLDLFTDLGFNTAKLTKPKKTARKKAARLADSYLVEEDKS